MLETNSKLSTMRLAATTTARIVDSNNILVALSTLADEDTIRDFFGTKIAIDNLDTDLPDFSHKTLYLCGNIAKLGNHDLSAADRIFVIKDLSYGYDDREDGKSWTLVSIGRVPMRVHGVGVYYRHFFDSSGDYFDRIRTAHQFQSLTESNKLGKAHRTGIYLTPVQQNGEELHFHLLRCSTNLSGATENFRPIDTQIVDALNQAAASIFEHQAPLNHVLAQIYHNTPATAAQKQSKAKISAHADKTKDMPINGIMAFCTFYDRLDRLSPLSTDSFDRGYKGVSGLTKLQFRLKQPVAADNSCNLPSEFTVTLYPNSVFLMPLSTNRLYTHEIRSSMLNAELLPTRLGYVVRCSSTEAVRKQGQTFLKLDERLVKLEPPTPEGTQELRKLYAQENESQDFIDYGDRFCFSMNAGDYLDPQL
jgi:hypothetical protein